MPNPDLAGLKKWLTDRQLRLYDYNTRQGDHYKDVDIVQALESLAASRATAERGLALLREIEWSGCYEYWKQVDVDGGTIEQLFTAPACPSCNQTKKNGHAPKCALAAELREGGE